MGKGRAPERSSPKHGAAQYFHATAQRSGCECGERCERVWNETSDACLDPTSPEQILRGVKTLDGDHGLPAGGWPELPDKLHLLGITWTARFGSWKRAGQKPTMAKEVLALRLRSNQNGTNSASGGVSWPKIRLRQKEGYGADACQWA